MSVTELVSVKEMSRRLHMSQSAVWLRVKRGQLPRPTHRFGPRCSRWDWRIVQDFIDRAATNSGERSEAV
jgi:predicted DNA-binding transcriptional regulator AlpA